jgi:uncharacterized protein (TIGR03067 family)
MPMQGFCCRPRVLRPEPWLLESFLCEEVWLMFRQISTFLFALSMALGDGFLATAQETKEADGKANSSKEVSSDAPKTGLESMQGTWTIVAVERSGQKSSDEEIKAMQVVIQGDAMILTAGKHEEKGTLKLNPSAKPKEFDLMPTGEKRTAVHGIYEQTAGTLRMCWAKEGGERPKEFATKPASETAMLVLKQEKK